MAKKTRSGGDYETDGSDGPDDFSGPDGSKGTAAAQGGLEWLPVDQIVPNPDNPRVVRDEKFAALVKSIQGFPQMLEKRPIVVNEAYMVLGGNMRLRAIQQAGLKRAPVLVARGWTEEQQREFIIKDNLPIGEWDWAKLVDTWSSDELTEWGLDVPEFPASVDYTAIDADTEVEAKLEALGTTIKRGIMIEFGNDDYAEAYKTIAFWRTHGMDVGKFLMGHLADEAAKLLPQQRADFEAAMARELPGMPVPPPPPSEDQEPAE